MLNFDQAPLLVIWETTQACDLACAHCRASARPERNANELSTTEAFRLLDEVKRFGNPLMVFTGGDPLKRPDIFEVLDYSVKLGLRTNISPSATPLLTTEAIDRFKAAGIARMAISLDGWDASSHDSFRGIPGTFDCAMAALRHARDIGLETQLQTTVTKRNMAHLGEIAALANEVKSKMWSLFFLVVTGRALEADDLNAEEYESVFEQIYQLSKTMPFEIKTTEAMHYRRYAAQRRRQEGSTEQARPGSAAWRSAGVSDGKGFVFVSHTGDICPSGFLPVVGGNVRVDSLRSIYRDSSLFRVLRDTSLREGKCGACEYRNLCGGSRARAYATTGDYLAADPRCSYHPKEAVPVVEHVQ